MKCIDCSNGVVFGRKYCSKCLEEAKIRSAERYKKIKLERRCKSCPNQVLDVKGILCKDCREKHKSISYKRKLKGLCITCGKINATKHTKCNECHLAWKEKVHANKKDRLSKGLCAFCDESRVSSQLCLKHFLGFTAKYHLGSSKRYQELLDLFNKQDGICPYTNKKLTLGLDASVDHIIPKSRGGSKEVSNLQWVYYQVNFMKQDLLEQEFFELIQIINQNFFKNRSK